MSTQIHWQIDRFENLDISKLYAILHLRAYVFVLEQNAAYLDLDNKDQKALHLQGYLNGKLVAYCRIFDKGDYFDESSIGRVVVLPQFRMCGYGNKLLSKAIESINTLIGEHTITISAQLYLKRFYESHGFVKVSEMYLEDGIPHIRMKKE